MKLVHIYWLSIALSATFFLMYWYAPWLYGYLDPVSQSILSNDNYGAMFNLPEWWFQVYLVLVLFGYAGLLKFRSFFRWWFVVVMVFSLITSPIYGMNVITGIEVFIIDTSTMLNGFIIALAFFSPLKERFY